MVTGKVFFGQHDKALWIVPGINLAMLYGLGTWLKYIGPPDPTAASHGEDQWAFYFLIVFSMILLFTLTAFMFWYLFLRGRYVIIDADNHLIYLVSVLFIKPFNIRGSRVSCFGKGKRGFIYVPISVNHCPKFYLLPIKGRMFINFAAALEEAGGLSPCGWCKKACPGRDRKH